MSSGRKHLLDLGYTVPTIERHAIYIMSHLVGQSTQRNFSQIRLGSYSKPEQECLISKLTSKRNITLIFDVPFAKGEMKPLTIFLHATVVYSAPQLYRVRI